MLAYASGMSGIAQQKTCMETTNTYINTSFCDGVQLSGKTCMPAGNTETTVAFVDATKDDCNSSFSYICGQFGGKLADGYCTKKFGSFDFCSINLRDDQQRGTCEYGKPCSVDTDCTVAYKPLLYCCPEFKILVAYACTGIDSGKFDEGVSF
jgi:hypothetical protein